MFNLPKKTALCILVALGATGCLSTSNDQPQPKEPINTNTQKTNADKKPASNSQNNQSAVDQSSTSQEDKKPTAPADEAKKPDTTKLAEPKKPDETAKPAEPAKPETPAEPDKPAEPITPPAGEKTEAQLTAEKIEAFNQRNYQSSAKSLQAKDYDGEDRYYTADVNVVMGDGASLNVENAKGFVNLPLGDFSLPTHGNGNYRKTEYGYNNVYSTIIFSDFDARTASDIYGTPLNNIDALPQEGSANYYGTFKGTNALSGNVVLTTDFSEKTVEGKITDLKDAKNAIADITLEKSKINTSMNDWTYEDEVVFKGKATGGKSEWKDMNYTGYFYGPTGEEAAAKLTTELDKEFNGYSYKEKTAIGVLTTTRDEHK